MIVIGAGLAGLTAACTLHQAGVPVMVLEGAESIGGRVQTLVDDESGRAVADRGPTWVWPRMQPVVSRWLRDLRVATFPQYESGDGLLDGWGQAVQRYPLPAQEAIMRMVDGPGALVAALARRLPAECLRTNATVTRIHAPDISDAPDTSSDRAPADAVLVTLSTGEQLRASSVVLAAPLRSALQRIEMPGASDGLRRAMGATPTWMSTHAKAVALFAEPFWRAQGLSGRVASRTGPLAEIHDHTPAGEGVGALFGFVEWSPSRRRMEGDALHAAILDQLARCFGEPAREVQQLHIEDWARRPLICSTADLEGPAEHPVLGPPTLRESHLGGRLVLAVSETSAVSPGLVDGALEAGERAARQLLSAR